MRQPTRARPRSHIAIACAVASAGRVATAAGEPKVFAEVGLGAAVPVGAPYSALRFGTSPSIVARAGLSQSPWAIETSLSFTALRLEDRPAPSVDSERVRITVGGCFAHPIGDRVVAHVRAAAGVEHLRLHFLVGEDPGRELDELVVTDDGVALDLGTGLAVRVGPVHLGARLGLAIGLFGNDRRGYHVEPLATIATSF